MLINNGFWVPALFIILSLPLIFKKVPPNHIYGFRTKRTLSNEKIWYKANKDCGLYFAAAGIFMFLYILLEPLYPVLNRYFAGAVSVVIIITVILSLFHIKKIEI